MTPAQAEAMDAVAHMTPQEIKDFAEILMKELERRLILHRIYQAQLNSVIAVKIKKHKK